MHASAVLELQRHRDYPSVSILLRTAPGPVLHDADRLRLRAHLDRLAERLRDDVGPEATIDIVERLRDLAERAATRPARSALALFAAPDVGSFHHLDVEVHERTMVDDSFATRDLLDQVRLPESYLLATVSERVVKAYEGGPDGLSVLGGAGSSAFPVERGESESARAWERRTVDALRRLGRRSLPLVLVGAERRIGALLRSTGVRPVAMIRGNHDRTPTHRLEVLAWPHLERWAAERDRRAVHRLETARSRHLLATGLDELWGLAHDGRVELLVVERSFAVPVRVVGQHLVPVGPDEVEDPEVVDDAVDDLIEAVVLRRGEVVLVPDGTLGAAGGVAGVLRY
jgi:hypothetical protein